MPSTPDFFPVSVIMESRPSSSIWQDVSWDAVGVCSVSESEAETDPALVEPSGTERSVAEKDLDESAAREKVIDHGDMRQVIYGNLKLRLYRDECESYYHNLMSPQPGCFVIAREDENDRPVPFLVSMSFDEAHAYQEGDDLVYAVPIPAELYRWLEAYVIEHYAPEKRKKRKRKDWKADKKP